MKRPLWRILIGCVLPALVLAAAEPGPAPRFDPWTIIGPGGGGTMISPTISPHDPRIVVEHCDMTGAYITLDGAWSWRMFNLRSVVAAFAYDPRNARVIYAGNEALWRSEDTGRTWKMIFPDPRKNTVEHQNGDHSEYSLTTGDTSFPAGRSISGIAIGNGGKVWLAFGPRRGADSSLLYSRAEEGAAWSQAREFPGERVLALETISGRIVVVGTRRVYRYAEGAWTEPVRCPRGQVAQAWAAR